MSLVFDEATLQSARLLVRLSLEEDLGTIGDITSMATIPESRPVSGSTGGHHQRAGGDAAGV